jgi:hypothetical protein
MISIKNRIWIKFKPVHVSKFLWSQECRMKTTAKISTTKVDTEIGRKLTHSNFRSVCFILVCLLPIISCKMFVQVTDWKQKREV